MNQTYPLNMGPSQAQLAISRGALVRAGIHDHAPRYSNLTTCVRAALYGKDDPGVAPMIERNMAVDQERQFAKAANAQVQGSHR